MPFFRYEAVDRNGRPISGTMDAASEAAVAIRLTQQGFTQLSILPPRQANPARFTGRPAAASTQPAPQARPHLPGAPRRMAARNKDCALFHRQLAALLKSGISAYEALYSLAGRTDQPALKFAAAEMAAAAHAGARISSVMAGYPGLFPPHVVAAVQSGEVGGFMDVTFDEIGYEYEQRVAFYRGFSIPLLFLGQALLALPFAQPVFPTLFPYFRVGQYLVFVGRNYAILAALLGAGAAAYLWWRKPENEERRHRTVLKLPVFGELARQHALSTFIRTLRRLYRSGIGPAIAWEASMNVASNSVIRQRLVEAYTLVQSGTPIHEVFKATGLFVTEMEELIGTGHVSGRMVDMLDQVGDFYQDNVERAFSRSRMALWRGAICIFIALVGLYFITLYYFEAKTIFSFPKQMFPEVEWIGWYRPG